MRRPVVIVLAVAGAMLGVVAAGGSYLTWQALNRPLTISPSNERLVVAPGSSLAGIARELASRGVLNYPRVLTYFGRLSGQATRIHAGEYEIFPGTTGRQLLDQLVRGQVFLHQITVVEGWRFEEFLTALRAHIAIVPTSLTGAEIMAELGAPGVHPEGQFAPDTYRFPRGATDITILEQAYAGMQTQLATAWANRSPTAAVQTAYDALILASIIEKETALASERRAIAGVFNRRLQRGMRLQTDPTVIYGLGIDFDGNLRRADLARDTPYNTYTRQGLPPTPIALPGREAIQAAVDPEEGSALYFVATGLPDGSHEFSTTLEEHNLAVARYLRRLRNAGRAE